MANWAYVENNTVTDKFDFLPTSWKNVTGLDKSVNDEPFLNSLSWFKVEKQHQEYDSATQRIVDYSYTFAENKVIETLVLEDYIEEKPSFEEQKENFLNELRIERNKVLSGTDWTQLIDTQNLFNEETKTRWLVYRQKLRDLPNEYSNNDVVDLEQVIWPTY
jgi:hypothetical protein